MPENITTTNCNGADLCLQKHCTKKNCSFNKNSLATHGDCFIIHNEKKKVKNQKSKNEGKKKKGKNNEKRENPDLFWSYIFVD